MSGSGTAQSMLPTSSSSLTSNCNVCAGLRGTSKDVSMLMWNALVQAKSECPACSIIHAAVSTYCAAVDNMEYVLVSRPDKSKACFLNPELFVITTQTTTKRERLELYTLDKSPNTLPDIAKGRQISSLGSSKECFALVQEWMEDCLSNHPTCARSQTTTLPTRVLDVGSHKVQPRLHISGLEEHARYIALSHCWGVARPVPRTTLSNLEQMKMEISFHDLPQTFQDAIMITRMLGVRYLWIDSLCIIQDMVDDWVSESSQMSQIYSNSLLVLAAAVDDSYSGLFSGARSRIKLAQVPYPRENGDDARLYVRSAPYMHRFSSSHIRGHFGPPRLATRGWTFQEHLLAPRVLQYGEEEISWECSETRHCECQVDSPGREYLGECKVGFSTCLQGIEHPFATWTELVEAYAKRELSFGTDLLFAISGVAAALQSSTLGDYVAGMWSNYMIESMAWVAGTHRTNFGQEKTYLSNPHQSYHAPSWSWASVLGRLDYWRLAGQLPEIKVHKIGFALKTANQYGPVTRAFILMSGRLIPITVEKRVDSESPTLVWGLVMQLVDGAMQFEYVGNPDYSEEKHYPDRQQVYLLPLGLFPPQNRQSFPGGAGVALILEQVDREKGIYKRIASAPFSADNYSQLSGMGSVEIFTFI